MDNFPLVTNDINDYFGIVSYNAVPLHANIYVNEIIFLLDDVLYIDRIDCYKICIHFSEHHKYIQFKIEFLLFNINSINVKESD